MLRSALISWLALLMASQQAFANVVGVEVNGPKGQGLIFLDDDGVCRLVTAKHVVRVVDGESAKTVILRGENAKIERRGVNPLSLGVNLDAVAYEVRGVGEGQCSDFRLGRELPNLENRLANAMRATMRYVDRSGVVRDIPLRFVDRATDAVGGGVFSVKSDDPSEMIRPGVSGSTVLTDKRVPIGLVTDVQCETAAPCKSYVATVLRYDVVYAAIRKALNDPSERQRRTTVSSARDRVVRDIVQHVGRSPSAESSAQLLGEGRDLACGWIVQSEDRRIEFDVELSKPTPFARIRLLRGRCESNLPIKGAELSFRSSRSFESNAWFTGPFCDPSQDGDVLFDCVTGPREALSIRVMLWFNDDRRLGIRGIELLN